MEFDLKELKYQRLRRELTIKEMAKKLNMKTSSYQKRENGNIKISVNEFIKIIEIFNLKEKDIDIFFKQSVDNMQQKVSV